MSTFTEVVRLYFSQATLNYGDCNIHSLTELLWHIYTERNPIDNDMIRSGFRQLEPYFQTLPIDEANLLFCIVCNICSEHERLAFLEGMRVGVLLMDELKPFDKR